MLCDALSHSQSEHTILPFSPSLCHDGFLLDGMLFAALIVLSVGLSVFHVPLILLVIHAFIYFCIPRDFM